MGNLIGHFAPIVMVSKSNKLFYPVLLATPVIDAVIVMYLTKLDVVLF